MNLIVKIFGITRFQKFMEALHNISIKGMNYGSSDFNSNGELNIIYHIREKLNGSEPLTLFDVGANEGHYTNILAKLFKNRIIYSFEPQKKTFEKFLLNTSSINNIMSNNFGFSDTETSKLLYSNKEKSGFSSLYNRELSHLGISMNINEEIKLSTIDVYCRNNNISRIHFLKLDIEGHELKVLKGAKQMINSGKIDFIQFEMGGCNIDSKTYFRDFYYLLKDKFRIYRILKNGLIEIPKYKETNEIFITVNYLAERID